MVTKKVDNKMQRAFTLIELMVAITLTALLLTLLYNASDSIKKGADHYLQKEQNLIKSSQFIYRLILMDILNSELNATLISNQDIERGTNILLHTYNSLHRVENPWVFYKVTDEKELLRIESLYKPKLPLNQATDPNIFVDIICNDTKKFKIYKKKNEFLIIFQCNQNRPIISRLIHH